MSAPPRPFSISRHAGFSWPLIVGALLYLALLALGNNTLGDPDTYWHLATGNWMLENRAIPVRDAFSHSMPGAPWVSHEWLSEVLIAIAYQAGGWAMVATLAAFAFATTLGLLTRFLLRELEPAHALMFVALAVILTAFHLHARPHVLAMPLMVAWTAHLVRASEERKAPSLWLLPLMALWANLHGGFTLGLALAVFFAGEALLGARRGAGWRQTAGAWAAFLALATASALLTPHGIDGILATWKIMTSSSQQLKYIGEWLPTSFYGFQPLELWLGIGMATALHQGLRLPLTRLVLLLGLLHMALHHGRYVELIGLLVPLFLAAPLAGQWRERAAKQPQAAPLDRIFLALTQPARFATVSVVAAALLLVTVMASWLGQYRPNEGISPAAALAAARQANLTGPVLNDYDFGGYLIFSGVRTFIDGRSEMYGDDFFREYMDAVSLKDSAALPKLLEKHRIQWTLLHTGTAAAALMDHLPGWRRLYGDKLAVVHARKARAEGEAQP